MHRFEGPLVALGKISISPIQPADRRGGQHCFRDSRMFMDFISKLGLLDLDLKGWDYTWRNRWEHPSLARLDRFLFNTEWEELFLASIQSGLMSSASDHVPPALDCKASFPST